MPVYTVLRGFILTDSYVLFYLPLFVGRSVLSVPVPMCSRLVHFCSSHRLNEGLFLCIYRHCVCSYLLKQEFLVKAVNMERV